MILTRIEEARRSQQFINMPKFFAFIKYLYASSGEQRKCSVTVALFQALGTELDIQ